MKTYLELFTEYAPELGAAIARMDSEFIRELESDEVTLAAFAVSEAFSVYWWAWHGGQSSRLYSLGSRFNTVFEFNPAPNLSEETLEYPASELLAFLEEEFRKTEK